jgi:hypothetical protein
MTMDRAIEILGINATKGPLQNIVRAFSMMTWLNTPVDTERREARSGQNQFSQANSDAPGSAPWLASWALQSRVHDKAAMDLMGTRPGP